MESLQGIQSAMVLAAGFGTRMRPLTDDRPKPLVEMAGRALIDHVLDKLSAAGVSQAVVNVHYLADILEAHLASRTSPGITISDERAEILDTGGGVAHALSLIESDTFFIHNSDTLWLDGAVSALEQMAAEWDPARMDWLLLLAPTQSSVGYDGAGDFTMDETGVLVRPAEGAVSPFVFAGVSITTKALFSGAPHGAFSLNCLWDRAIEQDRLYGIRLDGVWMHVGTPEAVGKAETLYNADGG